MTRLRCALAALAFALALPLAAERPIYKGLSDAVTEENALSEGRVQDALDQARQTLDRYRELLGEQSVETAMVRRNYGVALWQAGFPAEAQAPLLRAYADLLAAKAPAAKREQLALDLGDWSLQNGRPDEAYAWLAQAAKSGDPGTAMAAALLLTGLPQGRPAAEQAWVRLKPKDLEGRLARAQLALALGRHAEARLDLEALLKEAGEASVLAPAVLESLGDAEAAAGDPQAAQRWQKALELHWRLLGIAPCTKDARLEAAALLELKLKQPGKALAQFEACRGKGDARAQALKRLPKGSGAAPTQAAPSAAVAAWPAKPGLLAIHFLPADEAGFKERLPLLLPSLRQMGASAYSLHRLREGRRGCLLLVKLPDLAKAQALAEDKLFLARLPQAELWPSTDLIERPFESANPDKGGLVLVRHRVADTAAWLLGFQTHNHQDEQRGYLPDDYSAHELALEPRRLLVIHKGDDLKAMVKFMQGGSIAASMKHSGVAAAPEFWFAENLEEKILKP